ncbi:hypothetical protein Ocin01_18183 [Orchesella cincta]|uniref:Uncharacterized protein n=1 Tax=Orchesella cincta TaxID=48709 RepID=A0A1D2M6A3_ORCCI|nr:hypothetical protein Ocin01_18183 [Orchesella cincta]
MRINATACLVILIVHITVAQHPPRQGNSGAGPPGPAPVGVHTQGQPQPIRGSGPGQKVGPQASNQAPPASVGHPPKNPSAGHHTSSQNSNRNTNIQPHPAQQPTGQKPAQQDPKALSREVHKLVQESVKAHPHPHSNHNNPPGQPLAGNTHSANKPPIHRVTTPTTRKTVAAAATLKTTLRTTPKTTQRTTPKATTTKTTPRVTPKITPRATTTRTTPKATTTRTTPKATTTRTTPKATTKTTPKTTTNTTPKTTTRTTSTTAVPSPSSTLKLGPIKIVNFKPNTGSESEAPPPSPPQSIIRGPPRENVFVPYNPTKPPQQPSVNPADFTDPVQNLPIRTPESTPQHHQSVVDFVVPEQPVATAPVAVPLLPNVLKQQPMSQNTQFQEAELERHQMPVDTFDNNGPVLESRNQEEQFGNANLNEGGWVPSQDASTYNQAQEQLSYEPNSRSQPVIQPDYNMPEGNEKRIGTLDQDGYIQEQPYYNTFTQTPLTDYNSVYNDKENEPHLPHLPPYKFRKENLNEPTWARNSILHDRFLNQNNLDYDARDDYEDQSNSSGVAQPSVSVHLFVCILTIHSVFPITNKNIFLQYCN